MNTISAIIEPHEDGTLHLPLPEAWRHRAIHVKETGSFALLLLLPIGRADKNGTSLSPISFSSVPAGLLEISR